MGKSKMNTEASKKFLLAVCLLFLGYILAGCSGKEPEQEVSEPSYVYVAKQLAASSSEGACLPDGFENPAVEDGQMYFIRTEKYSHTVERIVLQEDGGTVNFADTEVLFSLSISDIEQEKGNPGEEDILEMLDKAMTTANNSQSGEILVDPSKTYCFFYLNDYAVDQDQNLYFLLGYSSGGYFSQENMGCMLCKRTSEGEWGYRRVLLGLEPLHDSLVVDGSGGVYMLTADGILAVDGEGRETGIIDTEVYKGNSYSSEKLLGDSQGNVYYFVFEDFDMRWTGMEVDYQGSKSLKEVKGLSGSNWLDTCTVFQGKVFFSVSDSFYVYDRETESNREMLFWGNSGLIGSHVRSCLLLDRERLLVWYEEPGMEGLYLLAKTPVDELPEKDAVVLAAFETSNELSDAIIKFNRLNKNYQVILETYGYSNETVEGAQVRRDTALTSSNPPDLLSLSGRNLDKDVQKGLLEDLWPYLDKSNVLNREDFLENALAGYTVRGSLVGIPIRYTVTAVGGRSYQVCGLDSWTMEDVYVLMERYPEQTTLLSDAGYEVNTGNQRNLVTREYLLESFCADWYLDEYVDWEKGKCDFDSEGFRKLLGWIGEHAKESASKADSGRHFYMTGAFPEDALLLEKIIDFESAADWEILFGEELTLLGYPTSDGRGTAGLKIEAPLAIVAGAGNKEGAWEFLEYYILARSDKDRTYSLSTYKPQLQEQMEKAVSYRGGDENPVPKYFLTVDNEEVPVYATSQEMAEKLMALLEASDFSPDSGLRARIISIVLEESEPYYTGDKTLDEAVKVIQNRAQLLLDENG